MWQHARTRHTLLCKERRHKVNNKTKASRHVRLEIRPNEGAAVSNFSTAIHYTQMILSERILRCDTPHAAIGSPEFSLKITKNENGVSKPAPRRWWPQQRTITISIEFQCRSVHYLVYCSMTRWRCDLICLNRWVSSVSSRHSLWLIAIDI